MCVLHRRAQPPTWRPTPCQDDPVDRRSTSWLLAALAAVLVFAAVAVDDRLLAASAHTFARAHTWVVVTAQIFAVMGSWVVLVPLTVGVVVLLCRRGHRWWALWVALCGMGGWMISESVKHLVDRQRPVWPDPFQELTSPSFPSGHSMAGVYGYVVFGITALALLDRRWPGILLVVFGLLMGPSRVLLGVHWPTDVLGGWLLAGVWISVCGAVVLRLRGSPPANTPPPAGTPP